MRRTIHRSVFYSANTKPHPIIIFLYLKYFRLAASVAQFGMLLRNSEFKSKASYTGVLNLARKAKGNDEEGYRSEFVRLVESAQLLTKGKPEPDDTDEEVESKPISKHK